MVTNGPTLLTDYLLLDKIASCLVMQPSAIDIATAFQFSLKVQFGGN